MSINYPTLAHFRHFSSLYTNFPSTTVENIRQITPFYAKQTQFCAFLARKRRFHGKTNPIQTQFKANKANNKANLTQNNFKQVNEKTATLARVIMPTKCYCFVYFLLFFKVPHFFGHLFGSHPSDMPVKIQHIAPLLMPGPCDPSASGYVLTIRGGKMSGTKNITSSYITIGCFFKYGPPWPVFVVGKINGKGRTLAVSQLGRHPLHAPAVVIFTTPAVNYIANCLFFVGIARTAEYLDIAVIIVYRLLRQIGHKKLEPGLYISPPFRRASCIQRPCPAHGPSAIPASISPSAKQ